LFSGRARARSLTASTGSRSDSNQFDSSDMVAKISMNIRFSGEDRATRISRDFARFLDLSEVTPNGEVSLRVEKNFIASVDDLEIHVYRDHNPPHFHVKSKQRNIDAQFTLEGCELWNDPSGKVRSKDVKKIKLYFKENPEDFAYLKEEYNRMNF
jgi:hypothetical protein